MTDIVVIEGYPEAIILDSGEIEVVEIGIQGSPGIPGTSVIDGGVANSIYGGTPIIDGGGA